MAHMDSWHQGGWDRYDGKTARGSAIKLWNPQSMLKNGCLELITEIDVHDGVKGDVEVAREEATEKKNARDLSLDLEKMIGGELTDFQIICHGEIIKCHKIILMSRSEYFLATLTSGMLEVATGKITITDVTVEIMKAMVKFIYSGKVEEDKGIKYYEELLKASDQYLLAGLKEMCQLRLMAEISVDNAIQMMKLGHMCEAGGLKEKAKETIICKGRQFIQLEDWKKDLKDFPDLVFEIMESVLAMQNR